MFEGLLNIPLLIKPPGAGVARESSQLVSHVDVVPTILAACAVQQDAAAAPLPGVDFGALLNGSNVPIQDAVLAEYYASKWGDPPIPLRCICTADWKWVETVGGDNELYHLSEDPLEERNLANELSAAGMRGQLQSLLRNKLAATGDAWPEVARPSVTYTVPTGEWEGLAATDT
jgi:arylsulfatase A-like enzyme